LRPQGSHPHRRKVPRAQCPELRGSVEGEGKRLSKLRLLRGAPLSLEAQGRDLGSDELLTDRDQSTLLVAGTIGDDQDGVADSFDQGGSAIAAVENTGASLVPSKLHPGSGCVRTGAERPATRALGRILDVDLQTD